MNDVPLETIQEAILASHGAEAKLKRRERVSEKFQGKPVWEGEVLVFRLLDHPSAPYCYAWEVDGKITAVLHQPPVDSAGTAVRAFVAFKAKEQI